MVSIQLNVIETSTPEIWDALVYPQQHPNTIQYIQSQFQNIAPTIMESGRKFIEDSMALHEKFYDSNIERAAKAAVRMVKNLTNPNTIQRLDSLEEIQSASPLMQRYIMSEPYLRQKYQEQLCSAYGGTYIDTDPGFLREWHYDWRRVNNGMVHFIGEGEDEQWRSVTYIEDLKDGDRELTFDEKIDILQTQAIARLFAEAGEDPTDPFGGKIG